MTLDDLLLVLALVGLSIGMMALGWAAAMLWWRGHGG